MLQWWRILLPSRRPRFHPWIWKIPWRRKWQPTPGITSSIGVYYSKNIPSIFAWKIPQKEGPGGLQSMESQRLRHDWLSANIREIQTLIVASVPSGCRSWGDRGFVKLTLLQHSVSRLEILPGTWMDREGFLFPVVQVVGIKSRLSYWNDGEISWRYLRRYKQHGYEIEMSYMEIIKSPQKLESPHFPASRPDDKPASKA